MLQQSKNFEPDRIMYLNQDSEGNYNGSVKFQLSIPDSGTCLLMGGYQVRMSYGSYSLAKVAYTPNILTDSGGFDDKFKPLYNNDKIELSFEKLNLNARYVFNGLLMQANADYVKSVIGSDGTVSLNTSSDNYLSGLISCDNKLCRGKIKSVSQSSDGTTYSVNIGKGINDILSYTVKDILHTETVVENNPIACAEIRTGTAVARISSYNKTTGIATILADNFNESGNITEGNTYEIYTSYIHDMSHAFITRKTPYLNMGLNYAEGKLSVGISPSAPIISHKYKIVDYVNNEVIYESDNIYGTSDSKYDFEILIPDCYSLIAEGITQDGEAVTEESTYSESVTGEEITMISCNINTTNAIDIQVTADSNVYGKTGKLIIYRLGMRESIDSEGIILPYAKYHCVLEVDDLTISDDTIRIFDFAMPSNNNVKYYIKFYEESGALYEFLSDKFVTPTASAGIYMLDYVANRTYEVNRLYGFDFITTESNGDIKSTLGINIYNGSTKPIVAKSDIDYESGSFSADLLSYDFNNSELADNHNKINQWLYFIKSDKPMLLKMPKGDCFIVKICGEPTRHYDADTMLTTVNFDWTEVDKIDKCLIKGTYFTFKVGV